MSRTAPRQRQPRILPWLTLAFLPLAAVLLILAHSGRLGHFGVAGRPEAAAMLPGITIEPGPDAPAKLVVTSIRSDSQAALRGIAVGDSVEAIDGTRIFSLDQARRTLQKDGAGTVELRVVHDRRARLVQLGREGV